MAGSETTEIFDCKPEQLFAVITDYEKYPDFLNEVKGCRILNRGDNKKLVEYQVSMVKSFTYRLWMHETPISEVRWSFDGGDLFTKSDGYWKLSDAGGGKTKAIYSVDIKFKIFVPGPIARTLATVNLPNMMGSYKKRLKEVYGG